MTAENEIVPFATGDGALVLDPATYASLPAVQTGFQVGVADPATLNTVWRQASFVAASVAQWVVNQTASSVNDDGNVAGLAGQIAQAIQSMLPSVPTATVHIGDDTSGAAGSIIATVNPPITSYAKDQVYVIDPANACSGATTVNLNGVGTKTLLHNDGTALAASDWGAGEPIAMIFDGTNLRLQDFTLTQIKALQTNATTVPTTTQTYVDKSTPRGATKLPPAFTAGMVVSDIAISPSFTTVQTSDTFTGATYVDAAGTCSLFDNAGSGTVGAGTMRLHLNDLTAGTSVESDYIGGGSQSQGTQVSLTLARFIQDLNPAHSYNLTMLCQKGSGAGPTEVFDARISGLHDGTNS